MDELIKALKKYFNKYVLNPLFEDLKAKRITLHDLLMSLWSFQLNVDDILYEHIEELLSILAKRNIKPENMPTRIAIETMLMNVSIAAYNYLQSILPVFEAELESDDTRSHGIDWAKYRAQFFLPDNHPGIDNFLRESLMQSGFAKSDTARKVASVLNTYVWDETWSNFFKCAVRDSLSHVSGKVYSGPERRTSQTYESSGPSVEEFVPYDPNNPSAFINFVRTYKPTVGATYEDRYTREPVEVLGFDGKTVRYKYKNSNIEEKEDWTFFLRHFIKKSNLINTYSLRDEIIGRTCSALRKVARKWFDYVSGPHQVEAPLLTKYALLGLADKPSPVVFSDNARESLWYGSDLNRVWDLLTQANYSVTRGSREKLFENLEVCIDTVLSK